MAPTYCFLLKSVCCVWPRFLGSTLTALPFLLQRANHLAGQLPAVRSREGRGRRGVGPEGEWEEAQCSRETVCQEPYDMPDNRRFGVAVSVDIQLKCTVLPPRGESPGPALAYADWPSEANLMKRLSRQKACRFRLECEPPVIACASCVSSRGTATGCTMSATAGRPPASWRPGPLPPAGSSSCSSTRCSGPSVRYRSDLSFCLCLSRTLFLTPPRRPRSWSSPTTP